VSHTPPAAPDLETLVTLFYPSMDALGRFQEVRADSMPAAQQTLLAHNNHMTVTVESWHNSPVDVQVLEKRATGEDYARKILLTRQSDGVVVQFGIMRIRYDSINAAVRRELESESTPLGRILIAHNLLRQVELASLWKITPAADLAGCLQVQPGETVYGRTALIYVNGSPAVELLEIVTPA